MRWSHLVRHGLIGTGLLAAAAPRASAEPCHERGAATLGFVVGVDLGPRVRLIGGAEGRVCVADDTELMMRVELGGGAPRLIAGARVRPFERAAEEHDRELLGIEAGGAIDSRTQLGLHLAGTFGHHVAYAALQTYVGIGEAAPARHSLLGGLAVVMAEHGEVVDGRPLRVAGHLVRPFAMVPAAASAEIRAVRDHFVSAAQLELSSVWTFLRLAAELAAAGAPAPLIEAALDAADDEVRHAELCAAAAGGASLWSLSAALARPRFVARSTPALALLAVEAWRDGCLNEAAAAEEARLAAGEAADPARAAMLAAIARDEVAHAALSWAILDWIFAIAPEAAASALAGLPPPPHPGLRHVDRALARHGVPTAEMTAAALAHATAAAVDRLGARGIMRA